MYDLDVSEKINELLQQYEYNWGQEAYPGYPILIPGMSQEKLVIVLERIVETGESILVGWNKCFLKDKSAH